jgi:RNA polymerase sigma factor (sigma-70 family)
MTDSNEYVDLVRQAQSGDDGSVDRLAELVREPLRSYIHRLTMDHDLTQDILQESLLAMFKFLDKLERADRFWPWMLKISTNNVREHYERRGRRRTVSLSQVPETPGKGKQESLESLISQELKQVVSTAMSALKPRYRTVITLRCYEEMPYREISEVMGCSEFAARRLFYRAKKALAKKLSRCGLGKGSLLLALALFGKMTATSEAAAAQVSVTAATTKVGLTAALVAMMSGKAAIVALTTAGVLTVGGIMAKPGLDKMLARSPEKEASVSPVVGRTTAGGEEYWYYYPRNANGAVMIRRESDARSGQSYCQWLQNDQGNYYKRNNTIYVNNHRMWAADLTVQRLPTDSQELREFLALMEGKGEKMEYVPSTREGLLVIVKQDEKRGHFQTTLRYDVSDEEYFRYSWPARAKIIDNRDAMHKRGWTYFRIAGDIGGNEVSGRGRIPFVHAASKQHYPWLWLDVKGCLQIVDDGAEACVYDNTGTVAARYESGSFFKGLGRPWMGLHTIDTVRRDAAEKRVWFETKQGPGKEKMEVVLTREQAKLVYLIDMENDVIEGITFSANEATVGELRFSYLQDIDRATSEFVAPRRSSSTKPQRDPPGILWLVQLVEQEFVR